MTDQVHRVTRDRLLVIASHRSVAGALAEHAGRRPLAAFLKAHRMPEDWTKLEPVVRILLSHDCEYFVCAGDASEGLHDRIDELVLELASPRFVATTWHEGDTADEVVTFFFNVAAATDGALLVAVLEPSDVELVTLLVQQASA
jgi:hypothetical protein